MKTTIQTNNKRLRLPSRMFLPKNLEEMDVEFVENQVLFNKTQLNDDVASPTAEAMRNMVVANYVDCSTTPFSKAALETSVRKQMREEKKIAFWIQQEKNAIKALPFEAPPEQATVRILKVIDD